MSSPIKAAGDLEILGELALGATLAVSRAPLQPLRSEAWAEVSVRPGTWVMLGRPDPRDRDELEEVVLVHADARPRFYDLYDEAELRQEHSDPTDRVLLLDGAGRDADVVRAMLTVDRDGLPWTRDNGAVVAARVGRPVTVMVAGEGSAELVAVVLGEVFTGG